MLNKMASPIKYVIGNYVEKKLSWQQGLTVHKSATEIKTDREANIQTNIYTVVETKKHTKKDHKDRQTDTQRTRK